LLTSAFSLGDVLAAVAAAGLALLAPPELAWRLLFWLGVLPALLVIWARTRVVDAPVYLATKVRHGTTGGIGAHLARVWASFGEVFGHDLRLTTIAATLLASGALSGRYVVTVWLPTYLQSSLRLDQTVVSAQMLPVLFGSLIGYVGGGYCQDRFGRRITFATFAIASVAALLLYVWVPAGSGPLLIATGFLLGICTSGVLSGLGAYLAELFPTPVRGLGQGFSYSTGRAVAAIPVAAVGGLAAIDGLGPAIAGSGLMYAFCLIALRFLPETRGKSLAAAG
ncbi:MAG: MFS transporter, partial [Dehalococcoidia bacterium]